MKPWSLIPGLLLAALPVAVPAPAAGETDPPPANPTAAETPRRFGPFEALVFDATVLQNVKFENNRIYLQRQVAVIDEAITLRASNARGADYRLWFNGSTELVSPARAGHAPHGWTDWVETTAPFVEYWMNGRLILHLQRLQP